MISNLMQPKPCAAPFRMPVGTDALVGAPVAMISTQAEVYTKGTTVVADGPAMGLVDVAASIAARPNAFGTWDVRTWSPPV